MYVAHSEVAYARGIEKDAIAHLMSDPGTVALDGRTRILLTFVRRLTLAPGEMSQSDADVVFDAGWSEQALHDAIAVTGRAAFMQRLVQGFNFTPMTRDAAAVRARQRIEHGYVNLYPEFRVAGR